MQTLLLMYVIGGTILALISLPLVAEKIKPNPFYGFRVPATMDNPDLWYTVNKFFGKRLLAVALEHILATVGLFFWPNISVDAYALSVLGVFVIVFGIAMIRSWKYLKSLS
ncbi:MAG: SdpI family protein [Chloroflexi bacterium]|nr:SdpI family protein [Chloroflexota bacterium]